MFHLQVKAVVDNYSKVLVFGDLWVVSVLCGDGVWGASVGSQTHDATLCLVDFNVIVLRPFFNYVNGFVEILLSLARYDEVISKGVADIISVE